MVDILKSRLIDINRDMQGFSADETLYLSPY